MMIIAEAGVNHNGKLDLAKKLVDEAKSAGADVIKFQSFIAKNLVTKRAEKAGYQLQTTGSNEVSQYKMLKELELSFQEQRELFDYCEKIGILFSSTAFDFESIDFLQNLSLPFWKIPSGEITNIPYLRRIGSLRTEIIMSTGMSSLMEIDSAITELEKAGTEREKITILHCTTEYPAPFNEVNLLAMVTLRDAFKIKVGYSDHTIGIEIPIAAAAMGAHVIEKHFTLDRNMEGPDHKASLEPDELKKMIDSIRNVETAMGDGKKRITESEQKNRIAARKSIVANKTIHQGDIFSEENLTVKRPGNGISPLMWDFMIGRKAERDYQKDELI